VKLFSSSLTPKKNNQLASDLDSPTSAQNKTRMMGCIRTGDEDTGMLDSVYLNYASAQNFHSHGLHSIFAFINLSGMSIVARICSTWRTAAYTNRLNKSYAACEPCQLPAIVSSPLRHYIKSISISSYKSCTPADLLLLQQLPSLVYLSAAFNVEAFEATGRSFGGSEEARASISRMFPRSLTSLSRSTMVMINTCLISYRVKYSWSV